MRHWPADVLLTRRGLIAGAGGLLIVSAARAALVATPPQTAGPFYPRIKPLDSDADLTLIKGASGPAQGTVIEVRGRLRSVAGHALRDAVVEIWQADSFGTYHHAAGGGGRDPNFQGYGAVKTAGDGAFRFRTIRPRHYGSGPWARTPHIHFRVVSAEGRELVTQMYFPGEAMNARDFIYRDLGSDTLRAAATAVRVEGVPEIFRYDIVIA